MHRQARCWWSIHKLCLVPLFVFFSFSPPILYFKVWGFRSHDQENITRDSRRKGSKKGLCTNAADPWTPGPLADPWTSGRHAVSTGPIPPRPGRVLPRQFYWQRNTRSSMREGTERALRLGGVAHYQRVVQSKLKSCKLPPQQELRAVLRRCPVTSTPQRVVSGQDKAAHHRSRCNTDPPLAQQKSQGPLHRDPAFGRCVKQALQVAWHKGLGLGVQDLLLIRSGCLADQAH